MVALTPVENDPFSPVASNGALQLIPVDHNPFAPQTSNPLASLGDTQFSKNVNKDTADAVNAGINNMAKFGSTAPAWQATTPIGQFLANAARPFVPAYGAMQVASAPVVSTLNNLVSRPVESVTGSKLAGELAQIPAALIAPSIGRKIASSLPELLADTSTTGISAPLTSTIPNIKAGIGSSEADAINAAQDAAHSVVSQGYQVPSLQATTLTPVAANDFNTQILDQIGKIGPQGTVVGSTINETSSPKTLSAVSQIYNRIVNGYTHPITKVVTPDVPLSVSEIDGFRKLLGNTSGEDSAAAGGVRQVIDNFLNSVDQSHLSNGTPQAIADLNAARATAAQNFKFQDVADIIKNANGDPTKIQRNIGKWLTDPENTNGLAPDALNALKDVANGTSGQKVLQVLGKLGFGTSNPMSALTTLSAVPVLGPVGAPAAAGLATAARYGNKLAVRGAAENAMQTMMPKYNPTTIPVQDVPTPPQLSLTYRPSATTYGVHPADVLPPEPVIYAGAPAGPALLTGPKPAGGGFPGAEPIFSVNIDGITRMISPAEAKALPPQQAMQAMNQIFNQMKAK